MDDFMERVATALIDAELLGLVQSIIGTDGVVRYLLSPEAIDYVTSVLSENKQRPI